MLGSADRKGRKRPNPDRGPVVPVGGQPSGSARENIRQNILRRGISDIGQSPSVNGQARLCDNKAESPPRTDGDRTSDRQTKRGIDQGLIPVRSRRRPKRSRLLAWQISEMRGPVAGPPSQTVGLRAEPVDPAKHRENRLPIGATSIGLGPAAQPADWKIAKANLPRLQRRH